MLHAGRGAGTGTTTEMNGVAAATSAADGAARTPAAHAAEPLVEMRGGGAYSSAVWLARRHQQQGFVDVAAKQEQREQLYEAYNMLHSLAQDFHKPFDSPAVLVVGHQTSGKSALIEALMGFQFNQVGGGTKTRRPIALRMQYNPDCDQPRCYLTLENGREEPRSLAEIQAYIEAENKRLERDPIRSFDAREIMIRMEYRFCPNMILIDTPGLIQAPRGKHLNAQQQALLQAAKECEQLVIQKMRCQDFIILCVEDTTDWKHATTRNVVMQVDPSLERTVLVCTKLDTKLPQFSSGEDLEDFIDAPVMRRMYSGLLGGPFFTSVPSGRVGRGRESAYFSNEAFVAGVRRAERDDSMHVASKLGPTAGTQCLPHVGVSRLRRFLERRVEDCYRRFLERRVEDCYRRNVARIVPLLQRELTKAEGRLLATERELSALSLDQLKASAEEYHQFGETLESEQLQAGSFVDSGRVDGDKWDRLMEVEVGNTGHRLFGGAQYHRVLREFAFAVRHMPSPEITDDEIANAAGIGDMHDGVNFMRAACVIAVEKARLGFDPLLESLRVRAVHVLRRLFAVVEHMLKREGLTMSESHQKPFSFIVRRIYENFIEASIDDCLVRCRDDLASIDDCLVRCRDDLKALTRFVTWDLSERSSGALHRSLPDTSMVQIYSLAVEQRGRRSSSGGSSSARRSQQAAAPAKDHVLDQWQAANSAGLGGAGSVTNPKDYFDLMQLMEEAACTRSNAERTGAVVAALVRHVMASWREHFARSVAMKFNCFFLMPFVDTFPFYLRAELDKVYGGDGVTDLFDIAEARAALARRREELIAECKACHQIQSKACHQIQGKFDLINAQLNSAHALYDRDAVDTADALASLDASAAATGWSSADEDSDSGSDGGGDYYYGAADFLGGAEGGAEGEGSSSRAAQRGGSWDPLLDDGELSEGGGYFPEAADASAFAGGGQAAAAAAAIVVRAPPLRQQQQRRRGAAVAAALCEGGIGTSAQGEREDVMAAAAAAVAPVAAAAGLQRDASSPKYVASGPGLI
ncbi:hypothetical protein JKP88DRAFT_348446 [Tribonema minus]|uniref:Dynamin-type G domain-containing protein n=1 Tax=Tribonema minus TaxID=303371 RepID=A0A835Z9B7_9STRA|nr:hypothetical protein JKP88DRAFT_348446 [Tribonema minus]